MIRLVVIAAAAAFSIGLAGTEMVRAQSSPAGKPEGGQEPRRRLPSLADVELGERTTLDQLVRLWGPPRMHGPAGQLATYHLDSGEMLWLSFGSEAPRRLTRAVLLRGRLAPGARILFDTIAATRSRRWDQLDLSRPLTERDVHAAWGPPDNVVGSGVERWIYALSGGESAALVFEGDRLSCGWPGGAQPAGSRLSRLLGTGAAAGAAVRIDVAALRSAVERDGAVLFLGTTPQSTHAAQAGTYIAALFADTSDGVQDYLWYIQHSDGRWSSSNPSMPQTDRDASNMIILDPRGANRDYGPAPGGHLHYTEFVGYFAVRPGSIDGLGNRFP